MKWIYICIYVTHSLHLKTCSLIALQIYICDKETYYTFGGSRIYVQHRSCIVVHLLKPAASDIPPPLYVKIIDPFVFVMKMGCGFCWTCLRIVYLNFTLQRSEAWHWTKFCSLRSSSYCILHYPALSSLLPLSLDSERNVSLGAFLTPPSVK
jgi:hypothetical protein